MKLHGYTLQAIFTDGIDVVKNLGYRELLTAMDDTVEALMETDAKHLPFFNVLEDGVALARYDENGFKTEGNNDWPASVWAL